MTGLTYLVGDATAPPFLGPKIIAHICNDEGLWGAGFVKAVSKRWPAVEEAYRIWAKDDGWDLFGLGRIQLVYAEPNIWIANMIGQQGVRRTGQGPPIRYSALASCLSRLARHTRAGESIHMPRIGCGLAGGEWSRIEPLIGDLLCAQGIPVFVYDLAENPITYGEYLVSVDRAQQFNRQWRPGQSFFNVLVRVRPDLAERIRATELDPFHHDERIAKFLDFVRDSWELQ